MTSDSLSRRQIVLERLTRNGILHPFSTAEDCIRSLGGIQYQVRAAGEMSLFLRVRGLRQSTLERGYASRKLINQWGQRKTLHLYCRDDYPLVCDVYSPYNYLYQFLKGREEELVHIAETVGSIAQGEEIDRDIIWKMVSEHFPEDAKSNTYAPYAVYSWCSNNGLLYQVPGRQRSFVRSDIPWEKDGSRVEESIAEMMRRYFTCFGPASRKDFCHMSGLGMSATEGPFRTILEELDVRYWDGVPMFSIGTVRVTHSRPLVLLGKYDPLLLSYEDKTWIAEKEEFPRIWQTAGRVEAVVVGQDGAVANWNYSVSGKRASFTVSPFGSMSDGTKDRLLPRFAKLAGFMGKEYVATDFL